MPETKESTCVPWGPTMKIPAKNPNTFQALCIADHSDIQHTIRGRRRRRRNTTYWIDNAGGHGPYRHRTSTTTGTKRKSDETRTSTLKLYLQKAWQNSPRHLWIVGEIPGDERTLVQASASFCRRLHAKPQHTTVKALRPVSPLNRSMSGSKGQEGQTQVIVKSHHRVTVWFTFMLYTSLCWTRVKDWGEMKLNESGRKKWERRTGRPGRQ